MRAFSLLIVSLQLIIEGRFFPRGLNRLPTRQLWTPRTCRSSFCTSFWTVFDGCIPDIWTSLLCCSGCLDLESEAMQIQVSLCKFASIWKVVKATDTKTRADPRTPPFLFSCETPHVWNECSFCQYGLVPIDSYSLHSALCFAVVCGWLLASADSLQQLMMCGKAWQQRVRPCQSKRAERHVYKPQRWFHGVGLDTGWMDVGILTSLRLLS